MARRSAKPAGGTTPLLPADEASSRRSVFQHAGSPGQASCHAYFAQKG